jgi:transketolase C-terminal domain/subunit
MRKAFIETLTELARQDARIVLLTADLGYTILEPFADSFPVQAPRTTVWCISARSGLINGGRGGYWG